MFTGFVTSVLAGMVLFAVSPSSTNYSLPAYDFGTGGVENGTSTNYRLNGLSGTQTGDPMSSTNYSVGGGENPTQNANVPPAPTLSNPANYYNRLQLVINRGANASDTKYLVAISSDGFATTYYVQGDNSIGSTYNLTNYRSYASYGSGSGFLILGLSQSTSYQVKVKALKGAFTETGYGPTTSPVATVAQSLTFGITTTLTPTPPFSASFSSLAPGSVYAANADINLDLTTNAVSGGAVYIRSQNAGLTSALSSYTISSGTADLALATDGYGAQIISATQSSGGPISSQSPYNGASDNVGVLSTSLQPLVATSSPVTTAASTLRLKARSSSIVPSATDFADTLTIVAAMNY